MTITNKGKFFRGVSIVVIILILVIKAFCSSSDRVTDANRVGWYQLSHKIERGIKVYDITTPRGVEKVVGSENLQSSLDDYRNNGVYNVDVKDMDKLDPSLKEHYGIE